MSKKRKKKLIEFSNFSEERYLKWILAVDKTARDLKTCLEQLSFNVKPFYGEQYAPELDQLLIEAKVDFFITTRGKAFERYVHRYLNSQYHVLWISDYLLDDPPRTAKAIEGALMYDPRVNGQYHWPWCLNITGQYITTFPEIKKRWLRRRKK